MNAFLIGLSWCDPEEVAACKRVGLDDDARCSTGIFIEDGTEAEALCWGKVVANKYMLFLFGEKDYTPEALEVFCWVEASPKRSGWKHCLEFFQKVPVSHYADYHKMTTEAYSGWCKSIGGFLT